jgi:hypothetical protein
VGSFEPFDEVEARRVGADDILTKPFQSIRNLVDRVGALLGRQTGADQLENTLSDLEVPPVTASDDEPVTAAELEAGTRELPPPELVLPPEEPMTTEEMEITTADTQRLSPEILQRAEQSTSPEAHVVEPVLENEMHTNIDTQVRHEPAEVFGEALLELDAFGSGGFDNDDVSLDVDFDSPAPEISHSSWAKVQTTGAVFAPVFASTVVKEESYSKTPDFRTKELIAPGFAHDAAFMPKATSIAEEVPAATESHPHVHQPEYVSEESPASTVASTVTDADAATPAGLIKLEQLSPEVVDAIARRVVEQLSERAVQEIAWEVVPQLADLMIKRKLEEHDAGKTMDDRP